MNTESFVDYRAILRKELLGRIYKNPTYSNRAFARDLRISSGFLSQILNGSRSLSEKKGLQIAQAIGWNREATAQFIEKIRISRCSDQDLKNFLYQDSRDKHKHVDMEIERFEVVSNWVHFAIMELTKVDGFRSDTKWISKRLGVSRYEVDCAIHRMIYLGLIHRHDGGVLRISDSYAVQDVPSAAIRNFHKAHLEKAAVAIDDQEYESRHMSGTTVSINPKQIPVARKMIKEFRRKLARTLEEGDKTCVYHIAIQLFQLDDGCS